MAISVRQLVTRAAVARVRSAEPAGLTLACRGRAWKAQCGAPRRQWDTRLEAVLCGALSSAESARAALLRRRSLGFVPRGCAADSITGHRRQTGAASWRTPSKRR